MKSKIKEAFYQYLKDPDLHNDELVGALEKERDAWHKLRQQSHDQKWRQNLAFYSGQHQVRGNGRNNNQYRVHVRENHTNNVINRMVSIFVQNMPITRVFPASDEYSDIQNADTCENYVKYFYRTKMLEQKYAKLVKYSAIFGNGFVFRGYDPYAGGMIQLSAEESGGEPVTKQWRGDIRVDVDDPMKINVRPGIEDMEDMFDFFRSVTANKADLEATYGTIDCGPVNSLNAYNGQIRADESTVMVHHYYHKPTHWLDRGMYVSYAGKKILKATTFPYKCGKLPLEHLPFDKPPMAFWAMSTIDQIIDLQEQLNRAASMIIEARNLIARPRVLASEESKVPGQSFTDRPGDILRYKLAGGVPQMVVPTFNFAEMAAHKADVRNALGQVSGMSNASRGEIPAATKTALALQLVLEQDRSQWAPFIKQFYQVIKNTNLGILDIAAEYFPESDPRVIKIEQNNIVGTKTFHGGLVPSPLDIDLEDTNPLGWTAGGRIEAVQGLYTAGIVTDQNQVLEMLKINNPNPAFQLEHMSRQTARKENELLNEGRVVEVESEDIDPIHLDEHVKEAVSFNFKYKPQPVRDAFLAHIAQHKERLAAAQAPPAPPPGKPTAGGGEALGAIAQQNSPLQQGEATMDALLNSARAG